MIRNLVLILSGVCIALAGLWWFERWQGIPERAELHEETRVAGSEAHGEHGGRLLVDGELAVEVTIFEAGTPPEFRVYAYHSVEPIEAARIELSIKLERLGGQIDMFEFQPQQAYLRGQGIVAEPHSFDVEVTARYNGRNYRCPVGDQQDRMDERGYGARHR